MVGLVMLGDAGGECDAFQGARQLVRALSLRDVFDAALVKVKTISR